MKFATIEAQTTDQDDIAALRSALERMHDDSPTRAVMQMLITGLANGSDLTLFERESELSPNEAARLLQMSRPHLLTFVKSGALASHLVGSHQRIKLADLLDFAQRRDAASKVVTEALHGRPTTEVKVDADALDALDQL